MGMRIAFLTDSWTKDPMTRRTVPASSPFYRCYLPMRSLEGRHMMGMPAWTGMHGFGVKRHDGTADFAFSTVSIKLMMQRWVPYQIEAARAMGQRVVSDVDDLYDNIDPTNRAFRDTDPATDKVTNRDHYRAAVLASDTITVSTPYLLDHYSPVHKDVRLVRNGIDPSMFQRRAVTRNKPVIGWVGALEWRGNDMDVLAEWLPEFLVKHDLVFHHGGAAPRGPSLAERVGIPEDRFTSSPIVPINHVWALYQNIDIGLVPLADVPFNRAKSFLKGLEYAASGVPFVASDMPEYRTLAESGVGLVAGSPEEWVARLESILDYRDRKHRSNLDHQIVMREHTVTAHAGEWESVFGAPARTASR